MAKRLAKPKPTWADVKAKLARFDRLGLLSLVQNLYTAHQDNQAFLDARLGLGGVPLEPYKKTIDRWLWPDVFRRQETSNFRRDEVPATFVYLWLPNRPDTHLVNVTS
jgi:hypothetical protein